MHWLETTSSTNDIAGHLAQLGADEGTTVVAETQTSGRGRHGRVWFSPPGAGLYVSVILRPAGGFAREDNPAALLTLASGVAVAEAVRAVTGLPAEIKWPNDVVIGRAACRSCRGGAQAASFSSSCSDSASTCSDCLSAELQSRSRRLRPKRPPGRPCVDARGNPRGHSRALC